MSERRALLTPGQIDRFRAVRERLEQERALFEAPRIKTAIARTKGSGRRGTYKGDKYFVDRLADGVDRVLYENGSSGLTRWKRKPQRKSKGKAAT